MSTFTKNVLLIYVLALIICLIAWPLLDLGIYSFLRYTILSYNFTCNVIQPAICAAIMTLVSMFMFDFLRK